MRHMNFPTSIYFVSHAFHKPKPETRKYNQNKKTWRLRFIYLITVITFFPFILLQDVLVVCLFFTFVTFYFPQNFLYRFDTKSVVCLVYKVKLLNSSRCSHHFQGGIWKSLQWEPETLNNAVSRVQWAILV